MRGVDSDDDYGEMPQNGTFHRRVEGLACDAGGRKALSTTFDMNRRVFVKTNEEGPILVALSCHLSKGALYVGLGASPAPSEKVHKCAVREFYSGGTIIEGLTIDKIFTSVHTGVAYRRRPEGGEPADSPLAGADWLLQKISYDEQYYFSLGLSDGAGGVVGGADSSKSYDASTFFREFYQPSRKADKKPPPPELKGRVDSGAGVGTHELLDVTEWPSVCRTLTELNCCVDGTHFVGKELALFADVLTGEAATGAYEPAETREACVNALAAAEMILSEKVSPERRRVQQFMQFGLDRDRQAEGLGRVVRDLYATIAQEPMAPTEGTGSPSQPRKEGRKEPARKARSRSKEPPKGAEHANARRKRRVSRSSSESEDESDSGVSSASDESRIVARGQTRKKAEGRGRSEEPKSVRHAEKRGSRIHARKHASPSRSIASIRGYACGGDSDSAQSRGGSPAGQRARSRTPPRKGKPPAARDSRSPSNDRACRHPKKVRRARSPSLSPSPPARSLSDKKRNAFAALEQLTGVYDRSLLETADAFFSNDAFKSILTNRYRDMQRATKKGQVESLKAAAMTIDQMIAIATRDEVGVAPKAVVGRWLAGREPSTKNVQKAGVRAMREVNIALAEKSILAEKRGNRGSGRRSRSRSSRSESPSRSRSRSRSVRRHRSRRSRSSSGGDGKTLSFKEHRTSVPEAVGKLLADSKRTLEKRSGMAPMAFVSNLAHAGHTKLAGATKRALVALKVESGDQKFRRIPQALLNGRRMLDTAIGKGLSDHVWHTSCRTAELSIEQRAELAEKVRLGTATLDSVANIATKVYARCDGKASKAGLRISVALLRSGYDVLFPIIDASRTPWAQIEARLADSVDTSIELSASVLAEWLRKVLESFNDSFAEYRQEGGAPPCLEAALREREEWLSDRIQCARAAAAGKAAGASRGDKTPRTERANPRNEVKSGGKGNATATTAAAATDFKGPLWANRPTLPADKLSELQAEHKKHFMNHCWFYMTMSAGCRQGATCSFNHPKDFPKDWKVMAKRITGVEPTK